MDLPDHSQGTAGRHKCCVCALWEGYSRGCIWALVNGLDPTINTAVASPLVTASAVRQAPVEEQHVERFIQNASIQIIEALRREASLVKAFCVFLVQCNGLVPRTRKIKVAGEAYFMSADVFVEEINLLIEAKGTTDRSAFRMAIGQLADYRRFLDKPKCAILLPSRPQQDLLELASIEGLGVIWSDGEKFNSTINLALNRRAPKNGTQRKRRST